MSGDAPQDLKSRLGPGARFDADAAPAADLLLARRGTAFFARLLNDLPDRALLENSAVAGWQRRHVVALVGLRARALCQKVETIRQGESWTGTDATELPLEEYATIPAHALRHLFSHSAVHLNVVWRDLTDAEWGMSHAGATIAATPLERAKLIWNAAFDLRAGAVKSVLPPDVQALLD